MLDSKVLKYVGVLKIWTRILGLTHCHEYIYGLGATFLVLKQNQRDFTLLKFSSFRYEND